MSDELELLRAEIDSTDEKLIELLKERMNLSAAVADVKARSSMAVYAPEREKQLMARVKELSGVELADYISAVYDSILSGSREYQKRKMKDIILIGMPGCGKSSVGRIVADMLGKAFYDTDCLIEAKAGCSIPCIFSSHGEDVFREIEHDTLKELSKVNGAVIATGGGTVLRADNRELIRENSVVIWLKRDINSLPKDRRPISMVVPLDELYRQRAPLYAATADFEVENDCESPQATAEKLIRVVKI